MPDADLRHHLRCHPEGEWVPLDGTTVVGADEVDPPRSGPADGRGLVGRASTTPVVAPRPDLDRGGHRDRAR